MKIYHAIDLNAAKWREQPDGESRWMRVALENGDIYELSEKDGVLQLRAVDGTLRIDPIVSNAVEVRQAGHGRPT